MCCVTLWKKKRVVLCNRTSMWKVLHGIGTLCVVGCFLRSFYSTYTFKWND